MRSGEYRNYPRNGLRSSECRGYEEVTCQAGGYEPLTLKNRFYGVQQLAGRVRLYYVSARTRVHGFSGNIQGTIFANE